MLVHCKAVARGARRAFLVGDMPFGSGAALAVLGWAGLGWACSLQRRCAARRSACTLLRLGLPSTRDVAAALGQAVVPARRCYRSAQPATLNCHAPCHARAAVEVSPEHAVRSAIRMMKEGGMDAIKIEGGFRWAGRAAGAGD